MTDLDTACAIIDDARHAVMDAPKTRLADRLAQVVLTSDALRLVREWEHRKRAATDPTPATVVIHTNNQARASHTTAHSPAQTIAATIIYEEMTRYWTPTPDDADRAATRVLAFLIDRGLLPTDPATTAAGVRARLTATGLAPHAEATP